ncbi:MAG: hypothetical protein WCE40_04595 [Polyangia bacterium]
MPTWTLSQKTHIFLFDVGRGLSVFIRTPTNHGLIYDMGCRDDFSPADFLAEYIVPHLDKFGDSRIAQTILSHPHADHISEVEKLQSGCPLHPHFLTCPHDRDPAEAVSFDRINNPKGTEALIASYRSLYQKRTPPLQSLVYESPLSTPDVQYGLYYVAPPVVAKLCPSSDQDYANSMSIVFYYRHGKHSILLPGDITPDILQRLLRDAAGVQKRFSHFDRSAQEKHPKWASVTSDQPRLGQQLGQHGLSVLVAPHHGLESGYSAALYGSLQRGKPDLVAISEKRHCSEADGKVDSRYQSDTGAAGLTVRVDGIPQPGTRSVTTRNGHHVLVVFQGTGGSPSVFLEKDPVALLHLMT